MKREEGHQIIKTHAPTVHFGDVVGPQSNQEKLGICGM